MMAEREERMRLIQTVDLGAIRRNVRAVRSKTRTRVLVMVKADAYGHGMTEVARSLADEADYLGVATLEEGEELRKNGVKTPVLVAICPPDGLARAKAAGLTAAVADEETLRALVAVPQCMRPAFHLKFDTGMHRLGLPAEDAGEVIDLLAGHGVVPEGAYSHFREPDARQLDVFLSAAGRVRESFPSALVHMASSSSLGIRGAALDMVRIGIAAYSGAMTVKSRVIAVRRVRAGECVGYGHFVLDHDTSVAVVFGGYFDGVRRESPSPVYIGDMLCPVCGSVCMDMFAVETGGAEVRAGDEVVLLGGALTAERVAEAWSATPYEVMTCWKGRIKRCYIDQRGSEKGG